MADDTPRAYTPEEVRKKFLDAVAQCAHFWATLKPSAGKKEPTIAERCNGVAFSILSVIDGVSGLPYIQLSSQPHPDDKQFHLDEGNNYIEPDTVLNGDCMLHDLWYQEGFARE